MLRCFLSHPSEHKDHAYFLRDKLVALYPDSVSIFLASDPSSLPPGEQWYDTILTHLKQSDCVLALLASSLAARPWILFEAGMAVALDKKVIPLRYAGLTVDLIPGPLSPIQSMGLTQQSEVALLLRELATTRPPNEADLRETTKAITKYFIRLETQQSQFAEQSFALLPLSDRIQLLTLASPTQRDLFFHIRDHSPDGMLESEIRAMLPIRYNRHGERGDPDLLISPSEYYFRLRELYFCGLIDMHKVSFHENRWWARDEVRMALYRIPIWGAPQVDRRSKQKKRPR